MTVEDLLKQSVTLVYREPMVPPEYDEYGNEKTQENEVTVLGELQQQQRQEPGGAGEFSATDWRLFLDGTQPALETADAIRVDGVTYELVGDPWQVTNPRRGGISHTEATVRRAA